VACAHCFSDVGSTDLPDQPGQTLKLYFKKKESRKSWKSSSSSKAPVKREALSSNPSTAKKEKKILVSLENYKKFTLQII
jgi:hypothetical protein